MCVYHDTQEFTFFCETYPNDALIMQLLQTIGIVIALEAAADELMDLSGFLLHVHIM